MPAKPADASAPPRFQPFEGVRVIDISNFLAAPMSAMFLADFGADVVKVERPGHGDEVRYWGRNKKGVGLYFKILGRGKRSITADLSTPFGVEVASASSAMPTSWSRTTGLARWRNGASAPRYCRRSTRA